MSGLPFDPRSLRIYDLAQALQHDTPTSPNHPPFQIALIRRHGDVLRADGSSGASDLMTLGTHTGTHIDALSHIAAGGLLHGGVDAQEASRGGRFAVLGAETIEPIVCRGILLDIADLLGVETVDPSQAVDATHLEDACQRDGITVQPGDAVLIRTGWARKFRDREAFVGRSTGVPGVVESGARWLADRGVRVTGADTIAYELMPAGLQSTLPVHSILIVEHGIYLVELLNLEELARDRVREFVFVAAPLKLVGATGSPIRPLGIVHDAR